MEEIRFTDEEMMILKKMQDDFNNLILQSGQLSIEEMNLKMAKEKLTEAYKELLQKEKQTSDILNKKYGDGILDAKTGIFTKSEIPATPVQ